MRTEPLIKLQHTFWGKKRIFWFINCVRLVNAVEKHCDSETIKQIKNEIGND